MIDVIDADLPVEEEDISATEAHNELVDRIKFGLRHRLPGTLVLGDIFVREGRTQVSPDVFTAGGAQPGARRVYRLADDPLPEVTIEVLSEVNKHDKDGIAQLLRKRRRLGELGIGEHIELDPIDGVVVVFEAVDGVLEVKTAGVEYTSERLAGTRFVVDLATFEGFRVFGADGVEFEPPQQAMARADAAQAQAVAAQAEAAAAQAEAAAAHAQSETSKAQADAALRRAEAAEARARELEAQLRDR